jgi:hypothetical protein
MSKDKPIHEKIENELVDRILKNFDNIEYHNRQQLKNYLSYTEIHTRFIR